MRQLTLLIVIAFGALNAASAQTSGADPSLRTWAARDGRFTTQATLLKLENGKVYLQKQDGGVISVGVDVLSDADQEYIKAASSRDKDAVSELESKCRELCDQIATGYKGQAAGAKPTIAVVEFSDLSGGVSDFGRLLSEELITRLFAIGNYKVIERLLLSKAIAEHKLQLQGLVDPKSAKELGKILGVDAIVSGTVADLGDSLRVNARLIATETGEVFAVAAVSMRKDRLPSSGAGGYVGAARTNGAVRPPSNETLEDKLRRHKRTINTSTAIHDAVDDKETWIIEIADTCTADEFDAEQTRLLKSWVSAGGVLWVNSNVLFLLGVRHARFGHYLDYNGRVECEPAGASHPVLDGCSNVELLSCPDKAHTLQYKGVIPLLGARQRYDLVRGTTLWSLVPYGKGWISDPKPINLKEGEGALFWGRFCQFCLHEMPWPAPRADAAKLSEPLPTGSPTGAPSNGRVSKFNRGASK